MFARPRNRSFAQQRASRVGGDFWSPIRFHAHAQVWNRTEISDVAELQVPRSEVDFADRRIGFRNLFQLLRLVCREQWTVFVGTVPAHVPGRVPLCGTFVTPALVAEI